MNRALIVNLNKSVKIRFKKGDELVIRIVDQKQIDKTEQSEEFLVNNNTPIAQAILGHTVGEKIKYRVEGKTQLVTIMEIK